MEVLKMRLDIVERKMEVIAVDHSKSFSKLTVNMVQLISWPKRKRMQNFCHFILFYFIAQLAINVYKN